MTACSRWKVIGREGSSSVEISRVIDGGEAKELSCDFVAFRAAEDICCAFRNEQLQRGSLVFAGTRVETFAES